MPRLEFQIDQKTGDRLVMPRAMDAGRTGPVAGQCECGSTLSVPRNGDQIECPDCGEVYRLSR